MSDNLVVKAVGYTGTLEVYDNKVRIVYANGAMGMMSRGGARLSPKEILIKNITAIQLRKSGLLGSGFIQFTIPGDISKARGSFVTGGQIDAQKDENAVCFRNSAEKDFLKAKEYIMKRMEEISNPVPQIVSPADEIAKLADLRSKGILTDAEFEAKKKQLLGL